jgi:glyoxylase-like metal-dependent hydrolase (beta-lactamase superfamily II)
VSKEDYEIVIVKYGTRSTQRGEVFLNGFIHNDHSDGAIEMDYYFWVIRNDERAVLVDTGFSAAGGGRRKRTFLLDPIEAFEALGVAPSSAPDVVVTHAHYDHIGNLSLFDRSRVWIARAELNFWSSGMRHRKQFAYSSESDEIDGLIAADYAGRVSSIDDEAEIAPGIRVVRLGGHTPGQLVVLVSTSEGEVLLASDAVHYYEEYDHDRPFVFVHDLEAMYSGFDRIRSFSEFGVGDRIVAGHDPDVLRRFGPTVHPAFPTLTAVIGVLS